MSFDCALVNPYIQAQHVAHVAKPPTHTITPQQQAHTNANNIHEAVITQNENK